MPIAVMTGGTAGIGAIAADILRTSGYELILGARSPGGSPNRLPLEMSDLRSVRAFIAAVIDRLAGRKIDALLLNAAVNQLTDAERTRDGFESHFGINHLAHHVILRALAPHIADGGRVVVTTADAHDPEIFKMAPPETADIAALAHGPKKPDPKEGAMKRGFRAYASSKLLNILMARAFAAQPDTGKRGIETLYFNPGFTPGTQIGRNSPLPIKIAMLTIVPIAKLFVPINTPKLAGEALAGLARGTVTPPPGRHYASLVRKQVTWPDISTLAADDAARDAAWRDSDALAAKVPA